MGMAAKPAVGMLIERMQSDIASVRRNAAEALGRLGGEVAPGAVDPLIRATEDQLDPVREEAVRALGNYGKLAEPAIPRSGNSSRT